MADHALCGWRSIADPARKTRHDIATQAIRCSLYFAGQ
jgi:hypothetical protein